MEVPGHHQEWVSQTMILQLCVSFCCSKFILGGGRASFTPADVKLGENCIWLFGIGLTMMVNLWSRIWQVQRVWWGGHSFSPVVTLWQIQVQWRDQAHSHYICLLLIYKSKLNTYLQKDRRKQQYTKSYRVKAFFPVFQQVDLTFR